MDKEESKKLTPSKVDELFRSAEDWNDIRQIMVNVNYFVGNQWIGWNRAERRIQALPIEQGEERVTRNKIRPIVTRLLAKHMKSKLKFDVVPASKEQQDIDAAKAAHKYLQFLWQELDFTMKTRDIFLNCLIKKRCAVKTWFDATAGDDITPKEGEPGFEDGMQPVFTGEIRARVCDPLTIFVDPAATTEDEIRWIIERKARDVDEIFEEYGVKVNPDANLDYLNSYDVTRVNADGIASGDTTRKKNMALVYELWYRPCKRYPKGAKITVCDGQELDYSEEAGELPYTIFGYIPTPGNLLYDAIVTDLVPVQREINVKRSMVAAHARTVGNAMWLIPLGSNVDEEELSDVHGGFVHYTPANNMKPERAQAPDIPSFYGQELANDNLDLDDMSGAREVSQGRLPSGLDTLGGLEIMVEQENEKLVTAAQNYEQGMKKVMQRILRLLKKHYTEERQARILGDDNEIEIVSFNGSDLTGNEDINVIQGSSLPEMKAAQQERIMLMWQSGAIVKKDGTPDTQTLLRLMGLGDSTELFEQHQLDENNAKMENKQFEDLMNDPMAMMAIQQFAQNMEVFQELQRATPNVMVQQPQPPPGMPQIWDSDGDEVHIFIHNTFRKTSRYREMPPELRMMVDMHYQAHVDRLQAPMLQQMAEQQAMAESEQQNQAQEADKNRQHQMQMKQMDQQGKAQSEALRAQTAMATANIRNTGRG